MSNSEKDFEQLFKGKFDNFEPESSKDLWPEIEAKLPRKKRRVIFIFLLFAGIAASVIGIYKTSSFSLNKQLVVNGDSETQKSESLFPNPITKEENNSQNGSENTVKSENLSSKNSVEKPLLNKESNIPQGNNIGERTGERKVERREEKRGKSIGKKSDKTSSLSESTSIPQGKNETENKNRNLAVESSATNLKEVKSNNTDILNIEKTDVLAEKPIPQGNEKNDLIEAKDIIPQGNLAEEKKKVDSTKTQNLANNTANADKKHPYFWLGFAVQSGIYGNTVKSPSDAVQSILVNQQDYENNKNLRRKIESPGIHWSFGLNLGYNFSSNWAVGTGFKVSQGYTRLNYNLIRNNNDRFESTTRIDPQYRGTPAFNPSDYVNGNDSIVAGSNFTHENRYFGREIPLFIQYKSGKENQKLRFLGELGVSFNILRYVSAYYADLDNVGFVSVQGKDAFPGFKSSISFTGGLGAQIRLKEDLNLNVMGSFSRAMTSQTRYERWFKEYPFTAGISFRLIKTF